MQRNKRYFVAMESVADSSQDKVSVYNREKPTPGSDVPQGERLYSKGKNYCISLNASW